MIKNLSWLLVIMLSLSCSSLYRYFADSPEVSLTSVAVSHISWQKVEMALALEIHNPNDFDLGFEKLDYKVSALGHEVGQGSYDTVFSVKGMSRQTVEIPFKLDPKSTLAIASQYLTGNKNLEFLVNGTVNFITPVGKFSVPIDEKKVLASKLTN